MASYAPRSGPAASSAEARALWAEWSAFVDTPAEWWTAREELERGRDLEARLAALQGPGEVPAEARRHNTGPHTTGTIAGEPTVTELADLIKAKVYEVARVSDAASAAGPAWAARDPLAYGAFASALYDATAAFEAARADAQGVVDLVPEILWAVTPANIPPPGENKLGPWGELTKASAPFKELYRRLLTDGQSPGVDMSAIPQPKGTDVDLQTYKAADVATEKIEEAAKGTRSAAGVVLVFAAGVCATALLVRK
ncbi:MAG: hypothetical protein ACHP7H_00830 [Hyphomicrobiales bacterium]